MARSVQANRHCTRRRRAVQRLVAERSVGVDALLSPAVPMVPQPTAEFRSVAYVAA